MIINKSGVAIRMGMDEMRVMGRNTQGVKVINLKAKDEIAAIAKVEMDKEVEEEVVEGDEINPENTELNNSENTSENTEINNDNE